MSAYAQSKGDYHVAIDIAKQALQMSIDHMELIKKSLAASDTENDAAKKIILESKSKLTELGSNKHKIGGKEEKQNAENYLPPLERDRHDGEKLVASVTTLVAKELRFFTPSHTKKMAKDDTAFQSTKEKKAAQEFASQTKKQHATSTDDFKITYGKRPGKIL